MLLGGLADHFLPPRGGETTVDLDLTQHEGGYAGGEAIDGISASAPDATLESAEAASIWHAGPCMSTRGQ